jgi:ABC-type transport system involved in multi-copper enzyme maturation permease subunit
MRIEARPLALLTREAVADASRRRIVPAVGVICFLSLLLVQSCSTCTANVGIDGRMQTVDLGRWSGIASFALLGLWSVVLAGLLAADHLRSIFEDGSATLLLTRPLSRPTLALARLAGSLVVSGGAGLVVCAGATFFLVARGGLALGPAFWATAAVTVGLATVAALAMLASLFLPRIVTMLVVLGFVGWVGAANVGAVSGVALTGISFVLDRFGPPLLSGILLALAPWADATIGSLSPLDVSLRAIAWLVASVAVLLVVFDQRELTRLEPR